jgi:hypothetical protein
MQERYGLGTMHLTIVYEFYDTHPHFPFPNSQFLDSHAYFGTGNAEFLATVQPFPPENIIPHSLAQHLASHLQFLPLHTINLPVTLPHHKLLSVFPT